MKCGFNQDIESSATNPGCIFMLVPQTKGQKTSWIGSDEIPSPCARCVSAGQITSWDSTSLSDTIFRVSGIGSSRFVLNGGTPQLVRTGSTGVGWADGIHTFWPLELRVSVWGLANGRLGPPWRVVSKGFKGFEGFDGFWGFWWFLGV